MTSDLPTGLLSRCCDHSMQKAPHPIPIWEVKLHSAGLVVARETSGESSVSQCFFLPFFCYLPPRRPRSLLVASTGSILSGLSFCLRIWELNSPLYALLRRLFRHHVSNHISRSGGRSGSSPRPGSRCSKVLQHSVVL